MLIGLVICLIIIAVLFVHFDVAGRLRHRALLAKVNEDKARLNKAHTVAIVLQTNCARKWSDPHTTADQEVQRVRELDSIWSHIRYIEEVQTHNDRCRRALHEISRNYKDLFPAVRRTDMELIARDVDIQGWATDGICGGTTTQWH
jgi:hypothetical protein